MTTECRYYFLYFCQNTGLLQKKVQYFGTFYRNPDYFFPQNFRSKISIVGNKLEMDLYISKLFIIAWPYYVNFYNFGITLLYIDIAIKYSNYALWAKVEIFQTYTLHRFAFLWNTCIFNRWLQSIVQIARANSTWKLRD